jgi:hypothetical protein
MATSYNVSALSDYINQVTDELITLPYAKSNTLPYVTVYPSVIGTQNINILEINPKFVDGSSCGYSNIPGEVKFNLVPLTVADVKSEFSMCKKDIDKKWLQAKMTNKSLDEVAFGEAITAEMMKKIVKEQDYAIWRGTTTATSGTTMGGLFKGFITTASGATAATLTGATTASNIISVVDSIIAQLPAALADYAEGDVKLFMSTQEFRLLIGALVAANRYHQNVDFDSSLTYLYKGTNVLIVGISALNDSISTCYGKMLLTSTDNMYVGLNAETVGLEAWYEKKDEANYVRFRNAYGTAVLDSTLCVMKKA